MHPPPLPDYLDIKRCHVPSMPILSAEFEDISPKHSAVINRMSLKSKRSSSTLNNVD